MNKISLFVNTFFLENIYRYFLFQQTLKVITAQEVHLKKNSNNKHLTFFTGSKYRRVALSFVHQIYALSNAWRYSIGQTFAAGTPDLRCALIVGTSTFIRMHLWSRFGFSSRTVVCRTVVSLDNKATPAMRRDRSVLAFLTAPVRCFVRQRSCDVRRYHEEDSFHAAPLLMSSKSLAFRWMHPLFLAVNRAIHFSICWINLIN